jgi:PDZ domain/Aspartyl protease
VEGLGLPQVLNAARFICLIGFLTPAIAAGELYAASRAPTPILRSAGGSGERGIVPVSIENGEVIVDVFMNGKGPFPMMFDTGSAGVVTPETAVILGLRGEGSDTVRGSGEGVVPVVLTRVKEMRFGDTKLLDQPLIVSSLPQFLADRGDRSPLVGLFGYELLLNFAVRLDYDHKTLTLAPAQDFHYRSAGSRVPVVFAHKRPVVPAAIDGIAGRFEIDAGSSGALALKRQFVEQHGFDARHPGGLVMKSGGVDGVFETVVTRVDRFRLANAEILRPAAEFPSQGRSGVPLTEVDGIIGYQILRQFVITFDYSRGEAWFERSRAFGTKTVQWKTGFQAAKVDGSNFRVVTVLPDSAAASAGISIGDVITEVDGRPAATLGQAEFGDLMRRRDGTLVRLGVLRDGKTRSIVLTLKELLR